jgi:lipopolysaccharide/colanic/teichoic acid biosynthesis glycosyltransferase
MIELGGQVQGEVATATAGPRACPVPTIWGERPESLHDRFWASRCVEVVRPGQPESVTRHGPALYLLLSPTQLVHLPLPAILKKLHWASPRLLRLRVLVHDPVEYHEHVDDSGGTVKFRRSYSRPIERTERAWITADAGIAQRWATAPTRAAAQRDIRAVVAVTSLESLVVDGESFDTTLDDDVHRWLASAVPQWTNPNAVLDDLYQFQPGVWAHESAKIDPTARIVGSAWIGAGQVVPGGTVIAGPVILPDSPTSESHTADRDIDWALVRSPHWSMPSLTARGFGYRALKRSFDILFSLLVLILTIPVYIPIMIAIVIEDGRPFFFAHRRQTLGGKEFPCLKFRTMRRDAEKIKAELVAQNAADGPQFFMENDPRVTKVGRILRKYQLDELPQFLNVLAGHMSVVGPRPSPDKENQYCPAWREARLSVRPGVTGLWQVSRTREPQTDFQEWIRYDLEYVQHQSFIGDLRIIIDTVRYILKT